MIILDLHASRTSAIASGVIEISEANLTGRCRVLLSSKRESVDGWFVLLQVPPLVWMVRPLRARALQGCDGESCRGLAAKEASNASGWKQSKENRSARAVKGSRTRVSVGNLYSGNANQTPNRFPSKLQTT